MHLNSCWESVKCFKIEIFFFASDSLFVFVIIFMFALTNSWLSCEADSSYIRKSDVAALSNTNLFSSHTYQMYHIYHIVNIPTCFHFLAYIQTTTNKCEKLKVIFTF